MWLARLAVPLTVAWAAPTANSFHQDLFALLQSRLHEEDDRLSADDKMLQEASMGVKELITFFSNVSTAETVKLVSEELANAASKEAWIHSLEAMVEMLPSDEQTIEKAMDGAQAAVDGPTMKAFLNGAFADYFGDSMTEIRDAVRQSKTWAQIPSVQSAVKKEVQDVVRGIKEINVRGMVESLTDEHVLRQAVSKAKGSLFPEPLPSRTQPVVLAANSREYSNLQPDHPGYVRPPKLNLFPRTDFNGYHPNSDPKSFRYVPQPMGQTFQVGLYTLIGFLLGTEQGKLSLSAFYEYLRHDVKYREICCFLVMMHQVINTVLAYFSSKYFVKGPGGFAPGQAAIGDATYLQTFTKIVDTSTKEYYDLDLEAYQAISTAAAVMSWLNTNGAIPPADKSQAVLLYELLEDVAEDMYDANPEFAIALIADPDVRAAYKTTYLGLFDTVGSTITLANVPAGPSPAWPEHTYNASKLIIEANIAVLALVENVDLMLTQTQAFLDSMSASYADQLRQAYEYATTNPPVFKIRRDADWAYTHPEEAAAYKEKELKKLGIIRPGVPAVGLDEDKNTTEPVSFMRTTEEKPKRKAKVEKNATTDYVGSIMTPLTTKVGEVLSALESIAEARGLKTRPVAEDANINIWTTSSVYEHFWTKKWTRRFFMLWGLYNGYNGGLQWMAHDPGAESYLKNIKKTDLGYALAVPGETEKYENITKIEEPFHRYWFQAIRPMIGNGMLGLIIGSFLGKSE